MAVLAAHLDQQIIDSDQPELTVVEDDDDEDDDDDDDEVEDFLATSATSRRVDLPGCSIQECLDLLVETPGVELGSELYMLGTRLFVKRDNREMFVALPNDDIRSAWLEQELEIVKSKRKH